MMRSMRAWMAGVAATALVALGACGGGGGSAGTPKMGGGGVDPNTPKAASLSIVLDKRTLPNTGTDFVVATVTAKDAGNVVQAGIPVQVTADNNADVARSATSTDASGKVTAEIRAGQDKSNRPVTVTAKSGELTATAIFLVTGAKLSAQASGVVTVGQTGAYVDYTLVDASGSAMANTDIEVTAEGLVTKGKTGNSGEYRYTFNGPSQPGTLSISAKAAGAKADSLIEVQQGAAAISPVDPGLRPVLSASVSADSAVVSTNTTTPASNRVAVRALFIGAGNNPIPRVRVRFMLPTPNRPGDEMSSASNFVYSDVTGVARAAFVPGAIASPTDGVVIRACWDYADFAPGTCPNSAQTTVTVVQDALNVAIATDNVVSQGQGGLTYIKKYAVSVVDSAGQAKGDVQISSSLFLPRYVKGPDWVWGGQQWVQAGPIALCRNEDQNRNGVLDSLNGVPDDTNGNGTLEPRPAAVVVRVLGNGKTDASGFAQVQIEYGRSMAQWIEYLITVTASGISGTEGRATYSGLLPYAAADATAQTVAPPFVSAPYGKQLNCADPN